MFSFQTRLKAVSQIHFHPYLLSFNFKVISKFNPILRILRGDGKKIKMGELPLFWPKF